MNHLLFSLRATADTVVNTLAMSIIFNVTPLWKVMTETTQRPGAVQLENMRTKRKSQSQSIVSVVWWIADRGRSLTAIVFCLLTGR